MDEMASTMEKFNINTPLRLAHFLAQCSHESGNFKLVKENLNYSAQGLRATFSKYFPTDAIARQYERQPQKIGSRVYADRMGNGNEASGEGFKYCGRGYIQLTGKSNYKEFSDFIGEDCVANPDLIATKYPLICDRGNTKEVVTSVTKRVNGGTHGLDDRIAKFVLYNGTLIA
jgi:putative chitinase